MGPSYTPQCFLVFPLSSSSLPVASSHSPGWHGGSSLTMMLIHCSHSCSAHCCSTHCWCSLEDVFLEQRITSYRNGKSDRNSFTTDMLVLFYLYLAVQEGLFDWVSPHRLISPSVLHNKHRPKLFKAGLWAMWQLNYDEIYLAWQVSWSNCPHR